MPTIKYKSNCRVSSDSVAFEYPDCGAAIAGRSSPGIAKVFSRVIRLKGEIYRGTKTKPLDEYTSSQGFLPIGYKDGSGKAELSCEEWLVAP